MPTTPTSGVPTGAAREIARELTHELRGATTDSARVEAAERTCARVSDGLSRWFGAYGSRALFSRALKSAQLGNPSLRAVTVADSPCVTGLAEAVTAHGGKATADGLVAMMTALADLIGRLVGDDLGIRLFEQPAMTSSLNDPAVSPANPADDVPHTTKAP
jgi:hypothetical protein